MKQINPWPATQSAPEAPCAGKSLFLWSVYGFAMLYVWRIAQGNLWAEAGAWAVAAIAGLALAFAMREA